MKLMKLKYGIVGNDVYGYRIFKRTWYGTKRFIAWYEIDSSDHWGDRKPYTSHARELALRNLRDLYWIEYNKRYYRSSEYKEKVKKEKDEVINYWKSVI